MGLGIRLVGLFRLVGQLVRLVGRWTGKLDWMDWMEWIGVDWLDWIIMVSLMQMIGVIYLGHYLIEYERA